MQRREFIQTTALALSGAMVLPSFEFAKKQRIGLQLYSLRDVIEKDPKLVLKKVAGFGYQKVETYNYEDGKLFGLSVKEFGGYAKSLGLEITSGHYEVGLEKSAKKGTLTKEWERAVADAKRMGQEYMVIAHLEESERQSIDDYKKVCEWINKGAEVCKKYGVRMGYHNHDYEFAKIEGQVPYELILSLLPKEDVSMELDLYWVNFSNLDPLTLFAKYPGRFEQWHVKDMDKINPKKQVDLGTGRIDFKSIFAKASQSGLRHFYIEQEDYPGTSLESVRNSINNLKKII